MRVGNVDMWKVKKEMIIWKYKLGLKALAERVWRYALSVERKREAVGRC